jgi:hypothetical protein
MMAERADLRLQGEREAQDCSSVGGLLNPGEVHWRHGLAVIEERATTCQEVPEE